MATSRRRSSAAAPAKKGRARKAAPSSGGFRGAAGAERALTEKTKQDTKRAAAREKGDLKPFRLYLKAGDTKEIVILDDSLDDLFFTYEHNLKNNKTGYWDIYTGCVKEDQICPICESAERESYYALMLSVIDFTPYTDRKGTEHEFSRKLMCVKPGQIGKFLRFIKREGSLRGAVFTLSRDGDSDPQIGNDIEFVEFIEEEALIEYEREWTDREGKVHVEQCSEVFDYDKLFPPATSEELAEVVGARPAPGSAREVAEEFKEEDDEDMEGDEELEDEDQEDKPWEDDEEEEEEEKPVRKSRGRAAAAKPARRGAASRRAAREEEPEEEEEEEPEEEAPVRRSRRAAPPKSAPATGRRSSRRR